MNIHEVRTVVQDIAGEHEDSPLPLSSLVSYGDMPAVLRIGLRVRTPVASRTIDVADLKSCPHPEDYVGTRTREMMCALADEMELAAEKIREAALKPGGYRLR